MTGQEKKETLYYECCSAYYNFVSAVNYVAYAETIEAIDQLEENGLLRHRAKQLAKMLQKAWQVYENKVRSVMSESKRTELWQNYLVRMHEACQDKLLYIRIAIKNNADKNNVPMSATMSQLWLAVLLTKQACKIYDLFFEKWRDKTTYNFEVAFKGGRLTEIAHHISEIERVISTSQYINNKFPFDGNKVEEAYLAWLNTMSNGDKMGKAAGEAIDLTPSAANEVERVRKELESKNQEAEESKTNNIRETLAQKYNTKRL